MPRTWIPHGVRHPKAALRSNFEKLRDLLADESDQTKDMLQVYRRTIEGRSTREELHRANAQFADLLRVAGLGTFFVFVPGSVIIIPVMVKAADRVGVRLLPETFNRPVEAPVFDTGADYLNWFAAQQRARTQETTALIGLATVMIDPGVFDPSPTVSASSRMLIDQMGEVDGLRVLDLGCGTGVLGLHAALAGAAHVTCADIDEAALGNARRNVEALHMDQIVQIVKSDCFDALHGEPFDLILANLPVQQANVLRARIIENVADQLAPCGRTLLAGAQFDAEAHDCPSGWARSDPEQRFGQAWWVDTFVKPDHGD